MKRVLAAIAVLLVVPAVASAHKRARSAQKRAMLYHALNGTGDKRLNGDVNFPWHIPAKCTVARISTAKVPGASNWGAWTWSRYSWTHAARCHTADGVSFYHFKRGRWYYVGGGSSVDSMPGMPQRIFRDLYVFG